MCNLFVCMGIYVYVRVCMCVCGCGWGVCGGVGGGVCGSVCGGVDKRRCEWVRVGRVCRGRGCVSNDKRMSVRGVWGWGGVVWCWVVGVGGGGVVGCVVVLHDGWVVGCGEVWCGLVLW